MIIFGDQNRSSTFAFVMTLAMASHSGALQSADWLVKDVAKVLFHANKSDPVNFSGVDLSFLDLSGLDFKQARLDGARLHASDLTGANLSKCNLQRAVLDRATLVNADFSDADLTGALIRLPHSAGSPEFNAQATPNFSRANLQSARIVGRFDGGKFRDANLEDAKLGPYGDWTQNTPTRRLKVVSGDFSGARLARADLSESTLSFSKFIGAKLTNANLKDADLTGVDFSDADLTGANVAGANFEKANLVSAKGLRHVIGRETALHWPRTLPRTRH